MVRHAFIVAAQEGRPLMKKRPTLQIAESSATVDGVPIIAPGAYPAKLDSVCAEVLSRMLNHERMTSLDAVQGASTTRLAAVVHYLGKKYGWAFESIDKAAGCRDGRIAWVSEYFLCASVIELAQARGAGAWCSQVQKARRLRRRHAPMAKRDAARMNAGRDARRNPNQADLFDNEG